MARISWNGEAAKPQRIIMAVSMYMCDLSRPPLPVATGRMTLRLSDGSVKTAEPRKDGNVFVARIDLPEGVRPTEILEKIVIQAADGEGAKSAIDPLLLTEELDVGRMRAGLADFIESRGGQAL